MKKLSPNPTRDTTPFDKIVKGGYQDNSKLKAIARPTSPISGISGFLFDIDLEATFKGTAESTDHYVEDNFAIQDHISLKPETLTLKGIVAELVIQEPALQFPLIRNKSVKDLLSNFAQGLMIASGYKQNDDSSSEVDSAKGVYDKSLQYKGRQTNAFMFFYNLQRSRMLFSVETPWALFQDMIIQDLDVTQGKDSNELTEFTVTFKKLRIVNSNTVASGQLMERGGRSAYQEQAGKDTAGATTQNEKVDTTTKVTELKDVMAGNGTPVDNSVAINTTSLASSGKSYEDYIKSEGES